MYNPSLTRGVEIPQVIVCVESERRTWDDEERAQELCGREAPPPLERGTPPSGSCLILILLGIERVPSLLVRNSHRRAVAVWLQPECRGAPASVAVAVVLVGMPPPSAGETLRVWLLSALVVHGAVAGNPDAKRLYDDLLSNYNKLVRPVVNTSDVLRVCIKLKLSQLIDVVSIPKGSLVTFFLPNF